MASPSLLASKTDAQKNALIDLLESGSIWKAEEGAGSAALSLNSATSFLPGSPSSPSSLGCTSSLGYAPSLGSASSLSYAASLGYAVLPQKRTLSFEIPELDTIFSEGGLPLGAVHEWAYQESVQNSTASTVMSGSVRTKRMQIGPHGVKPCTIPTLLIGKAATANKFSVWIGRECWPTPFLLSQAFRSSNVKEDLLKQCLFIDAYQKQDLLWAIETTLRSKAVASVVASCGDLSFATSKRFSLAAKQSGALGFLLRDPRHLIKRSAAWSSWVLTPIPSRNSAAPVSGAFAPSTPGAFAPCPSGAFAPCWRLSLLRIKGRKPQRESWDIQLLSSREAHDETLSLHLLPTLVDKSLSKKEAVAAFKTGTE